MRILIADDHQIFLEGLKALLQEEKHFEVVAESRDGEQTIEVLQDTDVDVAILDIRMPKKSGIEVTKWIKKNRPEISVLILTMHNDHNLIRELKLAGADGYILKEKGKDELRDALKAISTGQQFFGRKVMEEIWNNLGNEKKEEVKLTRREIQVLELIGKGKTSPEISNALNIAQTTVETHRRNLLSKLSLRNTLELVRYAVEKGI